jgi:hypothetical protein
MDDCLKRQTSTATPAEPGGFPMGLNQGVIPKMSNEPHNGGSPLLMHPEVRHFTNRDHRSRMEWD